MAEDKLIFPIGFDLEKGVKEAQGDVDKYLNRIAKAVEKHPLSVKIQIDKDGGISTTIKAERQRATKELTGLQKEMAEINKEWNALSAKERGGEMGARLIARYRELAQEAKGYTSTIGAAVKLEDRLARQREKSANAAAKAAQKTREYNKELQNQDGYLSRLVKRLAVYASFSAVRTFLTGVRDVTAEFELQRVSLGAIIQDQQRANQLFSEIKSFALKSPLKILDLTKYVKQVAAYKIETDKLFDTTKRLADVSVGLGVDMGRLVLAYGQVKAASYLRAAEIRQFTEAGIPMLELLAEKFTEIQGKAISTEQVMDLVSKRAVSFSMVEEIFKDMTDAGGMFYNMQEKQAQTLFGMWSKLGDAAAVMYEEIGNTGWVNEGMKAGIGLLESMMRNWRGVASAVEAASIAFLAIKGNQTIMKLMQVNTIAAAAATRNYARAQEQLNAAKRGGNTLSAKVASLRARAAAANRIAANSTNLWTVANYKLRASLLSLRAAMSANWVGVLLSAIAGLVTWIISARQETNRLNNELAKISAEGANKADEMTRNFERLAKVVVESADGSKRQNEALEELKRTYSDVIPAQDLTIDKLRKMKGAYDEVTRAIREKIYQQNLEQQLSTIQEEYGGKISKGEKKTKELLEGYGLSSNEVGRVMGAIREAINNGLLTAEDDIETRMSVIGKIVQDQTGKTIKTTESVYRTVAGTNQQIFVGTRVTNAFSNLSNAITKIAKPTAEMNDKIKKQTEYTNGLTDATGRYSNILKDVAKNVAAFSSSLSPSSNEYKLEREQYMIEQYANGVRALFEDAAKNFPAAAKININDFFVDGDINWDAIIAAAEKAAPQFKKALSKLKNAYEESIPQMGGWKEELQGFSKVVDGLNMGKPIRLFDDTTINGFKSLDEALQQTAKQYKDNKALAEQYADTLKSTTISPETRSQTEELKAEAETMAELSYAALVRFNALKLLQKTDGGGGSDTRLQTLNEIERTLTSINNKYEELVKKEGQTAALDYVKKNYASTLEYVNKLGKKFGLKFEMPTDFKDLQTYRKNIQKVIETLKMKGYEKAAIELELKIAEGNQDKLEKQIEKQLKELADRISRTKTAKEFYQKILDITGNREVSMNITMGVYGADLAGRVRDKFMQAFSDIGEAMQKEFSSGNVDLLARPLIDAAELVKKGWEDAGDGIATVFSSQYGIEQAGKEVEILVTPILPDGTVLSQDELDDYVMNTLSGAKDILKADKKGIVISVGVSGDGEAGDRLHQLQEAYYDIKKLLADGDYLGLEKYLDMLPEKVRDNTKIMIENMRNGNKIDIGKALFEDTVEQIKEVFKTGSEEHPIDIDISAAIDITNQRINYKMLADTYEKYKNDIIEKNRDTAKNIVREGQKTAAENILTWEKELAKAKDFEQQRTDIINRETQRREAIIKSYEYTPEEKAQRISLSYDLQAKELSKLNVEEFKASDDYIRVFQDLDKVSSQTLKRLKTRLEEMIATAKEAENIEGVKALVEALNKIQTEQEKRGDPIKGMIDSFKKYRDARKELHEAEAAEAAAKSEFAEQEIILNADIATAKQEQAAAQQQVDKLKSQGLAGTSQMVTAELHLAAATTQVTKAEQKLGVAKQKVVKATEKTNKAQDKQREAEIDFKNKVEATAAALNNAASTIQNIADLFGIAEDSELGDIVNGLVSGLQGAATIMMTILGIAIAISSACWWLLAIGAAVAAFSALFSWISNSKVRKANKEIEKQQEILDQLEYSYGRLEKAAEKAFGGDYIKNFKAQQANLQAQIEATQKQLAAEQSKGKKTDDDKVKEYKEQIRDLKDDLEDLQGTLSEQFLGTDLTSAARDFAKAWLDAYKEFSNTADAMSEKFQEMIENMVVESVLASVMQKALEPAFKMIDEYEGDFDDENFWREVVETAKKGAEDADTGATIVMKFLEQAGLSIRDLGSDLTGISRDIASASEESINGLAATMNTWSYYVSYVPQIAEHVAAMRAILESGGNPIQSGQGVTDLVTLQNQSLTHLQAINQHTAETVTECRRIAERCTAMAEDIHRVVVPKGTKGAYGIQTYIS